MSIVGRPAETVARWAYASDFPPGDLLMPMNIIGNAEILNALLRRVISPGKTA